MIKTFDEVQETVKLYEAKLKGKVSEELNFDHLNMKIIMSKNRKIQADSKAHKIRVIEARKLRIKISDFFNRKITIQKSNSLTNLPSPKPKSTRLEQKSKVHKKTQLILKTDKSRLKRGQSLDVKIGFNRNLKKNDFHKNNQKEQTGGMINLFDHFSVQQLGEIESNEQYFLVKTDLIDLFRKYMQKKRANSKDESYSNFMLKSEPVDTFLPLNGSQLNSQQMKEYILKKIGLNKQSGLGGHLLTNPLSTQYSIKKGQTKLQKIEYSHQHSMPHFKDFKIRQQNNIQKIRNVLQKRRRKLRNDIVYNDGIAAENRAIIVDKRNIDINRRNSLQNNRSNVYRNRLNTLHETYGGSVELTERLRAEFLKKRSTQLNNSSFKKGYLQAY